MRKLLSVFVIKCKAAGRYGEDNCIFNAKLVTALLLLVNILTIVILIVGRSQFLSLLPVQQSNRMLLLTGIVVVLFVLLSLMYPKRRILNLELSPHEVKNFFRGIIYYMILTVVVLFIVVYLRD